MSKIKENTLSLNLPSVILQNREVGVGASEHKELVSKQFTVRSKQQHPQQKPKMKSAKSEILKIPKARQLLNMDKHIYLQDVQKRLELLGDVKQQNYRADIVADMQHLCKPVKKRTKRHKTNFKIPLTKQNIQKMNTIVQSHIDINKKYMNEEKILLRQYEKTAPFNLDTLKFFDELDERKRIYKERFNYDKGNLAKNKLMLEHVILNRNLKRQLTLKKREETKQHAKNVISKLSLKI